MEEIKKYFPHLTNNQIELFERLHPLYQDWNSKINVISRKDMDNFYINHVLHSLAIAQIISFRKGTRILDVGTGGGFPGVPLAILFPESHFVLADSIEKKIKVVREVTTALEIENVTPLRERAENINEKFDFVVSRAVTTLPVFCSWVKGKIRKESVNDLKNGILYLKGGDIEAELQQIGTASKVFNISEFFHEPFFETKKVVHLLV